MKSLKHSKVNRQIRSQLADIRAQRPTQSTQPMTEFKVTVDKVSAAVANHKCAV